MTATVEQQEITSEWSIADFYDNLNLFFRKYVGDCPTMLQTMVQTDVGAPVGRYEFKMFTATYAYTIKAREGSGAEKSYLGCVLSGRTPKPGVEGTGGRDLADGPLCAETWRLIMSDIIGYELLPIVTEEDQGVGSPGPSAEKAE